MAKYSPDSIDKFFDIEKLRHEFNAQVLVLPPKEHSAEIKLRIKPNSCPICHFSIAPIGPFISAFALLPRDDKHVSVVNTLFRCPRSECGNLFFGQYENSARDMSYELVKCVPQTAKKAEFNEFIQQLSPGFIKIYNQALKAEAFGLDEIFGVALRKSLEFLIKDYCVHKNPEKKDDIRKKYLGNCIKEFIGDARLKDCAEKAAWLGNDETHYVRKWEDKDIHDLKALIQLSIHWIASEKLTEDYMKSFGQK